MRNYIFMPIFVEKMKLNKNSLVRYITIDKCLQNTARRWTLENLVGACTEALKEYQTISRKVGLRTIQNDIQIMRSGSLGFHAPIKVVDRKYYIYENPGYSITNIPLTAFALEKLSEVSDILSHFKIFSYFSGLRLLALKLEDIVHAAKVKQKPVIDNENSMNIRGLKYIEEIHNAIIKKQVLNIWYQSFKAQRPRKIILHPYFLKEYRNTWYVFGRKSGKQSIISLAIDRIHEIGPNNEEQYITNNGCSLSEYFSNIIGVTTNSNRLTNVHLFIDKEKAAYVISNPLHHSQQLITETVQGIEIAIKVVPNVELEKEILGYGENIEVISPLKYREYIHQKLINAQNRYEKQE